MSAYPERFLMNRFKWVGNRTANKRALSIKDFGVPFIFTGMTKIIERKRRPVVGQNLKDQGPKQRFQTVCLSTSTLGRWPA
jgi:hypothetical protein